MTSRRLDGPAILRAIKEVALGIKQAKPGVLEIRLWVPWRRHNVAPCDAESFILPKKGGLTP